MKIHIEFDTANESFSNFNDQMEVIFHNLSQKDWAWKQDYVLLDLNGNTIGKTWSEKEKEASKVS